MGKRKDASREQPSSSTTSSSSPKPDPKDLKAAQDELQAILETLKAEKELNAATSDDSDDEIEQPPKKKKSLVDHIADLQFENIQLRTSLRDTQVLLFLIAFFCLLITFGMEAVLFHQLRKLVSSPAFLAFNVFLGLLMGFVIKQGHHVVYHAVGGLQTMSLLYGFVRFFRPPPYQYIHNQFSVF